VVVDHFHVLDDGPVEVIVLRLGQVAEALQAIEHVVGDDRAAVDRRDVVEVRVLTQREDELGLARLLEAIGEELLVLGPFTLSYADEVGVDALRTWSDRPRPRCAGRCRAR
jgi:hypothetical protein